MSVLSTSDVDLLGTVVIYVSAGMVDAENSSVLNVTKYFSAHPDCRHFADACADPGRGRTAAADESLPVFLDTGPGGALARPFPPLPPRLAALLGVM